MKKLLLCLVTLLVSGNLSATPTINGSDLFDMFYDINAHGSYTYAQKVMKNHGYRLIQKEDYGDGRNYVLHYAVPGCETVEIGWQGAVGFGIKVSTSSATLGLQLQQRALRRGFRNMDGDETIKSDGKCFLWLSDSGFWMYGR